MRKWVFSCLIITLFLINPLKFTSSDETKLSADSLHEIQKIGQYDDNYGAVICITGDNDTLYVGTNIGFLLLNRSDPTTLSYLGEITLDERVNFIQIKDKILFVYTGSGLTIYNVTNYEDLVQIASYPTNDDSEQYRFIIRDEFGFKEIEGEDNKDNIVILNITNPQNISEISRFVVPFSFVQNYFVKDNFIYISTYDGLHVVNITDPTNPIETDYFATIHLYGYNQVFVDDKQVIYLHSRQEHSLLALNGSNPSSLTILDEITNIGFFNIIGLRNTLLLEIPGLDDDLTVVNTTNHSQLVIEGNVTYPLASESGWSYDILWFNESIFYVSQGREIFALNFSNVFNPEILEIFNCGGYARQIGIRGNHVYLADAFSGIEIIDIQNKTKPTKVSNWQLEIPANYMLMEDDLVYVYNSGSDLDILEISSPQEYDIIGSYRSSYPPLHKASKYGDYLYFVGGCEGLFSILNVKDKTNPKREITYENANGFNAIDTQANKAYLLNKRDPGNLHILDIRKLADIKELTLYELPKDSEISEIVIFENKAYLALEDRFMILELSKKDEVISTQELTNLTMKPMDLVITEDYAIIGCQEGVKIIQLETMIEVAHYYDGGSAQALAVVNNTIFVADGYDNLEILETNFELGKVIGPNTIAIDIPLSKLLGVVIPVVIIASIIYRRRKKKKGFRNEE